MSTAYDWHKGRASGPAALEHIGWSAALLLIPGDRALRAGADRLTAVGLASTYAGRAWTYGILTDIALSGDASIDRWNR